jgi:hypothetical protein
LADLDAVAILQELIKKLFPVNRPTDIVLFKSFNFLANDRSWRNEHGEILSVKTPAVPLVDIRITPMSTVSTPQDLIDVRKRVNPISALYIHARSMTSKTRTVEFSVSRDSWSRITSVAGLYFDLQEIYEIFLREFMQIDRGAF